MKAKTIVIMLLVAFGWAAQSINAAPSPLNGKHYQGIGKIKGQPIDCWVDLLFDDSDVEINVSDTYRFAASYTAKTVGNKTTVSAKIPGSPAATFTSTDGSSTLQGKLTLNGQAIDIWVLSVPAKLKQADKPAAELEKVVGDPDGYTAFVLIGLPNGQKMCATSDFVFNAADKSFNMTCDSPSIQKIFSTMHGSYRVDGNELVMTDATGKTVRGTLYDDGYYIKVPMGSASGITLSLVLIK